MAAYEQIITDAMRDGGLLDALLSLQKAEGYVSEDALSALAKHAGVSDAALYDAASFYSMLRFTKPAQIEIRNFIDLRRIGNDINSGKAGDRRSPLQPL